MIKRPVLPQVIGAVVGEGKVLPFEKIGDPEQISTPFVPHMDRLPLRNEILDTPQRQEGGKVGDRYLPG